LPQLSERYLIAITSFTYNYMIGMDRFSWVRFKSYITNYIVDLLILKCSQIN